MDAILIVEPDSETLELLAEALGGYEIHRATNRTLAIAQLNRQLPDLIVMNLDLRESENDGADFAERLKWNKTYKHIPIILMSAETDGGLIAPLLERSRVDDSISTPIDPETLCRKVRQQLDTYHKVKQRTAERHSVQWRTDYHVLDANEMLKPRGHQTLILNISEGGVAFLSSAKVKSGDICGFSVYVPLQERPFLAIGQIAWVKPVKDRHLSGVKWLFWKSEAEQQLSIEAVRSAEKLKPESGV